jgi:hypothetical protein
MAYMVDVAGGDKGAEPGELVVHEAPSVALHGDEPHLVALDLLWLLASLLQWRSVRSLDRFL